MGVTAALTILAGGFVLWFGGFVLGYAFKAYLEYSEEVYDGAGQS